MSTIACAPSIGSHAFSVQEEAKDVVDSGPLHLLDLPLDVLKAILKEVTHTNDLTALSLTNSTLHGLVTPLIYSRFDIVWPDGLNQTDPRTGVDALTFGLATLVMRQEIFEKDVLSRMHPKANQEENGTDCSDGKALEPHTSLQKLRRGNHYSHHVKKFSLGNGPPELVQDYVVTKDSGKLLGTMVALAIARMPSLETFIWDMPTGILRDVWLSLSSLGEYQPSKLQEICIRFHNNKKAYEDSGLVRSMRTNNRPATAASFPMPTTAPGQDIDPGQTMPGKFTFTKTHVESPNFSILPPLRSIGAFQMDELANLNELSLLIGRSLETLRDLRVGMATELLSSGFSANSRAIQYLDPRSGSSGTLRVLFSGLPQCRPAGRHVEDLDGGKYKFEPFLEDGDIVETGPVEIRTYVTVAGRAPLSINDTCPARSSADSRDVTEDVDTTTIDPLLMETASADANNTNVQQSKDNDDAVSESVASPLSILHNVTERSVEEANVNTDMSVQIQPPFKKLNLFNLELERHVLNVALLRNAVDFSVLTSLTLLKCADTHELWYRLSHWFAPTKPPPSSIFSTSAKARDQDGCPLAHPQLRRMPTSPRLVDQPQLVYRLNLKRLHTDTVSPQLLTFLKQTLAPNSLEWLFLQDCPEYKSPVTVLQIFRGILRRHRGSLTKLLLDSANGCEKSRTRALSARKWMLNRDLLASLLSSERSFSKLRELSVSLEYKDFHCFLQQLPNVRGLRSLHIPMIADHVNGTNFNIRDVAMSVVDVINLRQECELAYLAIANKCFEIVEARVKPRKRRGDTGSPPHDDDDSSSDDITPHVSDDDDISDDEGDDDDDDDDDDDGNGLATTTGEPAADAEDAGEGDDASSSDEEISLGGRQQQVKMKLREILFYDDKVSIFKARSGKL